MAFDSFDPAALQHDFVEPPGAFDARGRLPPPSAVPARLVLFVGAQPSTEVCELLAQDGMRSLCLGGPAQALRAAALACFDALVIDAAQLGSRAAAWLDALRSELGCPLVVVAEHADEIDEILALELGADAYLARPLAPRRLRAHLAALLRMAAPAATPRRAAPVAQTSPLASASLCTAHAEFGDPTRDGWQLDRAAHRLTVDGRAIAITEVQGALLQRLLEARGRIVPRASLAAALRSGSRLSARSVDVYIHRLRERLQTQGLQDRLAIESVRGRGYRIEARPPCQ